MDWFSGKVLHKLSLEPVYKLDVKIWPLLVLKRGNKSNKKAMEKLTENVKIICLQTPIWKVSCHRSIISGLLGSFNWKWQGFSMVCSESELRLVDIVYISWLNKISSKGQIGSTCMGPLASGITFAKKKIISRSKITLVLARIEFWKNSTEYRVCFEMFENGMEFLIFKV